MKKLVLYLLIATATIITGCDKYDDSAIWEKLTAFEGRIATLEQLCSQMNTNITSLQTVIAALQNNDYVTNIAPITEDGKEIGYTITFSKSGSVTIYHGKDGVNGTNGTNGQNGANGKDGSTPAIGVKKADDGIYYWTINGEWLLDNEGNKIKAQGSDGKDGENGIDGKDGEDGTDGKDGENGNNGIDGSDGENGIDGITPKLKIENEYWYVSYDGGNSWEELGKATGEDGTNGDSMFENITYDDDYVYLTLIDGYELIIPRHTPNQYNKIFYTTTDGKIVKPEQVSRFYTTTILSNKYEDGQGVITFASDVTIIEYAVFKNCATLKSIILPESVSEIEESAFEGCRSLESIILPDKVTNIGKIAFNGCTSLKSATLSKNLTTIGEKAFANTALITITIPGFVTEINAGAFYDISSLESVTFLGEAPSFGSGVFNGCENLSAFYGEYTSPDNKSIIKDGELILVAPNSIASTYTIPNGITKIGDYVFANSSLENINIPDSVTEIGDGTFQSSSLTSITLPKRIKVIGDSAFRNTPLTNIILPSGIEKIGWSAFSETNLSSVTIPNTVEVIQWFTFSLCYSLEVVNIADGVKYINPNAFQGCNKLTSITLPASIIAFSDDAFRICENLTELICLSVNPPILDNLAGNLSHIPTIRVPAASVDTYKAAEGWKNYADKIVAIE